MSSSIRRVLSLLVVLLMVVAATNCTPIQAEASQAEIRELEMWFPSCWAWAKNEASAEWGDQPNYKAIEEACGVRLNVIIPTGTEDELIGPMIASGELPETMVIKSPTSPYIKMMHDAGMLQSLTDIANEYAPEILDLIPAENFNYWTNPEDGKLWFFSMSVSTPAGDAAYEKIGVPGTANNNIMFVRKDILAAFGKEDITSFEDYNDFLYFCKENYPDVEPIKLDSTTDMFLGCFGNHFASTFGVHPSHFYITEDDRVEVVLKDPAYVEMLRWMNGLFRDGIISANQFTDQEQQLDEKTNAAKYGSMVYAIFHVYNTINTNLEASGLGDQTYVTVGPIQKDDIPYKVAANTNKGGRSWLVTREADAETAALLFKYALSPEGQRQMFLGVEGKDYTLDAEGNAKLNDENYAAITADLENYVQTYNVISKFIPFGTEEGWAKYIDTWLISGDDAEETIKRLPSSIIENIALEGLFALESSIDTTSDDGVIMTKVNDSMTATAIKMIAATSDEEFEQIYNNGLSQLEALKVARYEEILTQEHQAQLASLS